MDPGVIAVCIPIVALMIPIVGMLIKHQQRMAELIHQSPQPQQLPNSQNDSEMSALRNDLARLTETVTALTLNVENLKDEVRVQNGLQERIKVDGS